MFLFQVFLKEQDKRQWKIGSSASLKISIQFEEALKSPANN